MLSLYHVKTKTSIFDWDSKCSIVCHAVVVPNGENESTGSVIVTGCCLYLRATAKCHTRLRHWLKGVTKRDVPNINCQAKCLLLLAARRIHPWNKMFLLHTAAKRDAPKQGIPLHIIFELCFTPDFYQNTSFSMFPIPFALLRWRIISGFRVRGIGRRNQWWTVAVRSRMDFDVFPGWP